jgi:uncharacterized protein (DUF1800 family)
MALTREQITRAHLVLNRYGLGAKSGAIARIGADARAALLAEINNPALALITDAALPNYRVACNAVDRDFSDADDIRNKELQARIAQALKPEIGFLERLVMFFSNHFSISINKDGAARATIGQLERDVIRKNVLGSFRSMLLGVMRHPAMLDYLDNSSSVGPNSPYGQQHGQGLNENLGRELLELHTLGVGSGYTQADVTALARILTGWSVVRGWEADQGWDGGTAANRGQHLYRASRHEPGAHVLLGTSYAANGVNQGISALSRLAVHPKTAEHLAFKLIHHFITDDPTPAMVTPVAQAFLRSAGNIKTTVLAMLDLPAAFTGPLTKLRTPYELQLAEMRATGRSYRPDEMWPFFSPLEALRHIPWERRSPDGFPDETEYWLSPDGMRVRLETATMNAWALQQHAAYPSTPSAYASAIFNSALSTQSKAAIAAAPTGDKVRGMATLFMLPEFQWR